jgi:hypothetical protein
MEDAIANEIALGRASLNPDRDSEKIANAIDAHLDVLYRAVPHRGKKGESRPTLRGLSEMVISQKEQLSMSIENMLDGMKSGRKKEAVGIAVGNEDEEARRFQRLEAEANARRLEVECQVLEEQKKRLQDMQRDFREGELALEKAQENPNELLSKKFAAVSDRVLRSRFRAAVSSLAALSETVKKNAEEIRNVRSRIELDSEAINAACRQATGGRHRRTQFNHAPRDDVPENIVEEAKKRLDLLAMKRGRSHWPRV